ncbi:hypothetical protein PRZ48_012263 [Zasmidium cellare]|uniref:EamA domain-containing protein n=1 Tax=Zasmidium cellare TaxID=395010 RepID=A0ABR0E4T2_ZASCE|nr:hypothetical protein PRZ48_012263 [Zasmidium cellare]
MSLPVPKEEPDSKAASISLERSDPAQNGLITVTATPKLDAIPKNHSESNGFLSAPLSGPIRPHSPDTLSNLSADEYEQMHNETTAALERTHSRPVPTLPGWRGKLQEFWIRNKGLVLMLIAQVFGTAMNVTTRLLEVEGNQGKGLDPFQILFVRMGITFLLSTAYMWWKKTPHFPFGMPEVRWLLVARGFGGFFGVFGMYYSLLYLPLADATVITFLAPGLACWACSLLINEPFTRIEQIGTVVSFTGIIFIARPSTLFQALGIGSDGQSAGSTGDMVPGTGNSTVAPSPADASNYDDVTPVQRLSAVGIALLGVVGTVTAFTTIRWIGKRAHPLISVNYFAVWCTLVSVVMMIILPDVGFVLPSDLKEWGYLLFLGICGFVMQFLLAAALAYEKSSRATNMTYTQMLFALAADKMIFDHTPGVLSIIGSSLILGSAIVVALQKSDEAPPKETSEGSRMVADEEANRGLLGGLRDVQTGEDHDRLPLQEVQLRTLR